MSAKKVLLGQFELHHVLYNNVLDAISDEEADARVKEPMNSIKFLAGHLLWAQTNLGRIAGVKLDMPWIGHFAAGPGAPPPTGEPKGPMPTIDEVKAKWNEFAPIIRTALENLPDTALDTLVDSKHPIYPFDNTLGGLWAFLNHHQAYTIGQLGILRRGHHKEAMKYS